jgi:F-type H+-transporting ATPase subunit epsilon
MAEAIADTIELEVVTPERQLVKESVTEAQIPAREGYIGVLPGHAPLLSLLGSGPLSYAPKSGPRKVLAIHGGFVEVLPDHIRVLANLAERAEEIDLEKARAALKLANEHLTKQNTTHGQAGATDPAVALSESELARARVDAAEMR